MRKTTNTANKKNTFYIRINEDKVDIPWDGAFPIMLSPCSAAYKREPPACFLIHPPGPPPLSCLHSVSLTAPGAGRASIRSFSPSVPAFLCLALSLSSSVPLPLSLGARDGLVLSSWFSQAAAPYACEAMCVCVRVRENERVRSCVHVCTSLLGAVLLSWLTSVGEAAKSFY